MQNFIKKFITLIIKKKIKYHDVSKFLNTNDLFFDVGAHLGEKSKELIRQGKKVYQLILLPTKKVIRTNHPLHTNTVLLRSECSHFVVFDYII